MEEAFIKSNHPQIHENLVATSNPNKMGSAPHYHEEPKLTNERNEEEEDTKRKKELFPQGLTDL